jgi:hypothetical protein
MINEYGAVYVMRSEKARPSAILSTTNHHQSSCWLLPQIFIISEVINAFSSLGNKGYTSMIKLGRITIEIRNNFVWFEVLTSGI